MRDSSPASSPGLSDQPPETRLESWKEIATYVKRDVSTVQRWEKREGMPVHRHLHDKRGSVYALSSELDAWMQSRRPQLEGEGKEQGVATPVDAATDDRGRGTPQALRWLVLGGVAVLGLLAGSYVLSRDRAAHATGPKITSLAVLPLKNLSGDPDQQYFVDGLTDEITANLARLDNLRVVSGASATLSADTRKPLPQIARELNVDAAVTGTVEKSGNRVRVRANLVLGGTNEVLWAEGYDRDLDDVLDLEEEVSQAIAHEVGIKLTPQAQHQLGHRSTRNPEAHDAYLRARYFLDRDDKEGATRCLQYFQEAIAKDPSYAAAYSGLSRCYDLAYYFDMFSYSEAVAKQRAATVKAVELDEGLGEAHSALADYYFEHAWDFRAAEREYQRALELDPNSASVHEDYSFFLQRIGRANEAVKEIQRARELDPLSLHLADAVAWSLLYTRRYDEAVDQFHKVLEMDPNYRRSLWGLARVYEVQGKYKEAIAECLKIPALPKIDPFAKVLFSYRCSLYQKVYRTSGRERINRKWFESSRQEIKDYVKASDDLYFVTALYAASGEDDKALDLLEQLYARRDNDLVQLKVDPRMDNLRSNPRFQALLRRMNFPE
jgi:TolB-like protein/tetratricopeptide (TPR) repeat protein